MVNKQEAITLLDNYLELEYNVDPIYNPPIKWKAHRTLISENDYCWIIPKCKEEEMYHETFKDDTGKGIFYVDKETADLFEIGSAPHIPFEEDFIYFKKHGQGLQDWFPLKSKYLEAKVKRRVLNKSKSIQLKAKYESRAVETKEYLLQHFEQSFVNLKGLEIRYKPIDGIDCLVLVKANPKKEIQTEHLKLTEIESISLPFTGGFDQFTKTLMELKKWIRVNRKRLGADTWIEIIEHDWTKSFNEWKLEAHLTFTS